MYRALYRKWRPLTFDSVVEQTRIVDALQNQVANDKVGHAYIFTGTRGTGKTTCAKVFAKAVNCPNSVNGNPCGKCDICRGVDDGSLLDVVEIDAASNNGVDDIRDLREETIYTPSICKYKVYIIDEVHMLSTQAFNALLKTMEEPPPHIIFILATTEIHKVPATILSRCQRYDFMRISVDGLAQRVELVAKEENILITNEAAQLIARLADGAVRDALSILDTCAGSGGEVNEEIVRRMAGVTDKSYLFDMSTAINEHDTVKATVLLANLRENSIDMKRLTEELIVHYRNLMLATVNGAESLITGVSSDDIQKYIEHAKSENISFITGTIRALGECLEKMSKGIDPRIQLELTLFMLCQGVTTTEPVRQTAVVKNNVQPVRQSVPVQTIQPPPVVLDENTTEFNEWNEVINKMQSKSPLMYNLMKGSTAYKKGKFILINGTEFLFKFIRENNDSNALIRELISEVSGYNYNIGPYKSKETKEVVTNSDESLKNLQALGVSVEWE